MLTILWNRNNLIGDKICEDFNRKLGCEIGISAEIPQYIRMQLSKTAPVGLYDTGLFLDTATEEEIKQAINDAKELEASKVMISVGYCCDMGKDESLFLDKLVEIRGRIQAHDMELLITNRRPYAEGQCVSAEKLLRLSTNAEVMIAHDIGSSHAHLHAMENYYDWRSRTAVLLLNDNLGAYARLPVGDYWYNPLSRIDIMQQPGWGSAPFPAIFDDAGKDIPMYFNGMRHQNASLEVVWEEIHAIMEHRIYINPAGAQFGKNEQDRLLRV